MLRCNMKHPEVGIGLSYMLLCNINHGRSDESLKGEQGGEGIKALY